MTTIDHTPEAGDLRGTTAEASQTGARLDEHHTPETNGWMAVCRRCGAQTDGPQGSHAPHERQLARANAWLDAQGLTAAIARLKSGRDM